MKGHLVARVAMKPHFHVLVVFFRPSTPRSGGLT